MKKSERIALNIAALALAHIIMAFLTKMSAVHRPYIILSMLFDFVYYFLLVQMVYRSRVVFSKQLFDREAPWYKQLGIVRILLLFAADVVISFVSSLTASLVLMFMPLEELAPRSEHLSSTAIWSFVLIWVSYMVYYLILTGKNAFSRKKTSLMILGVTFAATAVFCVVENSIHVKAISIENSMTQYLELLDYSNTVTTMSNLLKCLMACVIVVFCELGAVGKDVTAQVEVETISETVPDSTAAPDDGNVNTNFP